MFEELKKKTFKASLVWSVILLILGIGFGAYIFRDTYYAVAGYDTFEQLTPEEIKNQTVDFAMTANFGCYLEEYEYNSKTNYTKTTDLYYIIWTGDDYATDYRYMTIKVPADFEDDMEAMAENSYNNLYSEPIYVSGKIKELSDEEYEYFVDFFEEGGWTAEEIAAGTLPYYIDTYDNKTSMNVAYIAMFVGCVLLVVWGIYRIIKGAKGGYLKKLQKDYTDAGYTESTIASDYNHAFAMDKNNSIKIGRLMTYYQSGSEIRAIHNEKMIWAYMNTVTHRTNGIKTGTSYSVQISVNGQKNFVSLTVANEQAALAVLEKINAMFPWVIVGYSDQLKKLHSSDMAQFLSLRYNTCEHVAVEPGFENFS